MLDPLEQRQLALPGQIRGIDVLGEVAIERVVARHLVKPAAFFMQTHPHAPVLVEDIADVDPAGGGDPGKGEHHDADKGPIAQPHYGVRLDGAQQLAGLFGSQYGGLALAKLLARGLHGERGVVLEHATGVANLRTGEKLTPRHRFRIASHSKSFTAAGILKLREQKKLGLDDAVGKYVRGLHRGVAQARLSQLLSHGAGITRDGDDAGLWTGRKPYPDRAKLLNIRYTGLQAYSIMEGYERMKAGMRLYRAVDNPQESRASLPSTLAEISPLFRDAALVKQRVHQRRLAMIDVGDDGDVAPVRVGDRRRGPGR